MSPHHMILLILFGFELVEKLPIHISDIYTFQVYIFITKVI